MTNIDHWQLQEQADPKTLIPAMTQLHHAAQSVALFSNSLLPKAADDSQSSMVWLPNLKALSSQEVSLDRRVRMALLYDKFELQMIDENEDTIGLFPLSGQTKSTALSFVRAQVRSMGAKAQDVEPISQFELPKSPLDQKAPFSMTAPAHHQELARYRHNADLVLKEAAEAHEYASPVAVWPHHFDTGSVITVAFDDTSNAQKTIGIGFAPADAVCDEPYYYVNQWAKDGKLDYSTLPDLPAGAEWKTGEWKGAVLPASEIAKHQDSTAQHKLVASFLKKTIAASLEILDEASVKA